MNLVAARPAPTQLLREPLDRRTLHGVEEVGRATLLRSPRPAGPTRAVAVTGPGERRGTATDRHAGQRPGPRAFHLLGVVRPPQLHRLGEPAQGIHPPEFRAGA